MSQKYFNDILNQPKNWQSCLDHSFGDGFSALQKAAEQIRYSKKLVISGIGASFNVGLALEFLFKKSGFDAVLEDSSELMHQFYLERDDVLLLLSRSGKSIELLKLLELARQRGIPVISICNDPASPLAVGSDIFLGMNVAFDHTISVATSSAIILVGIVLDHFCGEHFDKNFERKANLAILSIEKWMQKLLDSPKIEDWLRPENAYYFLARGGARSASQGANLLWEEGVKMPATAKTTGSFRHGPVEIISEKLNVMIFLEKNSLSFEHDLLLAKDLKSLGVSVLTVGFENENGFDLPEISEPFQFLAQQIPGQLAAFYLSKMRGVDADSFRYCNFIVETEGGIF